MSSKSKSTRSSRSSSTSSQSKSKTNRETDELAVKFFTACRTGDFALVSKIVKACPKELISKFLHQPFSPCIEAAKNKHWDIVEFTFPFLIDYSIVDKTTSENLAHFACNNNYSKSNKEDYSVRISILKMLFDPNSSHRLNVNTPAKSGWNCIMYAIFSKANKIVDFLLKQPNLELDSKTKFDTVVPAGSSILDIAVKSENEYVIRRLQSVKSDWGHIRWNLAPEGSSIDHMKPNAYLTAALQPRTIFMYAAYAMFIFGIFKVYSYTFEGTEFNGWLTGGDSPPSRSDQSSPSTSINHDMDL